MRKEPIDNYEERKGSIGSGISKQVPVRLADGRIQLGSKIYTLTDPGYLALQERLVTSDGNDFDTSDFQEGLLTNKPESIRLRQLMIQNGIISPTSKLKTVVSAYEDILENQSILKKSNPTVTLEQVIQNLGLFNSSLSEAGGFRGPTASVTEVDYGLPEINDKSQGAKQARKEIQDYFRASIGRLGSSSEIEEMRVALVKASAKAKPVTTVNRVNGKTVTKTTPGFDLKSWASGYISNKFATEDVDGILGQAQDQLRNAARQYGIDMGTNWYAEKSALVGKGQSVEDFLDDIRQSAASRYVGVADRINKGETFDSITSPYKRAMSNILEIDENSIDYSDPTIQQAVNMQNEQGQFMTKPIWQFEKDLRKDPRWQKTSNARASYDNIMLKVLKDFGLMG